MASGDIEFRTIDVNVGPAFGTKTIQATFSRDIKQAQVVVQSVNVKTVPWHNRFVKELTWKVSNIHPRGATVDCSFTYAAGEDPQKPDTEWSLHGVVTLLFIGIHK